MNYREHKTGGICAGVATSAMLFADNPNLLSLVSSAILITGASIGCVLPDIDSATSKIYIVFCLRHLSQLITSSHFCYLYYIFLNIFYYKNTTYYLIIHHKNTKYCILKT